MLCQHAYPGTFDVNRQPVKEDSETEDEMNHSAELDEEEEDDDLIAEAMQGLTTLQHGSPRGPRKRLMSPQRPRKSRATCSKSPTPQVRSPSWFCFLFIKHLGLRRLHHDQCWLFLVRICCGLLHDIKTPCRSRALTGWDGHIAGSVTHCLISGLCKAAAATEGQDREGEEGLSIRDTA